MGKAARREARERLRQERIRQQQRAKRNRLLAAIGAAAAVIALVVGGGYLVMNWEGEPAAAFDGDLAAQTLQQDGSVVMAQEGASAPVVEVYVDFQCPACQKFEEANADTLKQLAAEGEAIVHLRPVSIFAQKQDPVSTNSLRAGAAARAAADHGRFVEYNDKLFANQPVEGRPGFSPEDLKKWGEEVGITDPAFAERVDAESGVAEQFTGTYYTALIAKAQQGLSDEELSTMTLSDLREWGRDQGVDDSFLDGTYVGELLDTTAAAYGRYEGDNRFGGTPSVYINGELQGNNVYDASGLTEAVESAQAGEVDTEPLSTDDAATPGPSPSESSSAKDTSEE
ncbi:protein-disulfide isomerase [Spinactinospora alkalitolerans]|uniref:Protein-disulfide isomerase n=1 Tax=Spinactinospora alkalitolerans TaxID=687207 RepID=A0A852TWZ5_9ACTN|nr:DsbA family protein [Spinactinospora alkalitolerans]NYE48539.1 protein-disulfide isomerase [Spinactinospora alkalitolerans]